MPTVLKISDLDGRGVLAFDLRHLLALLPAEGAATLHWRVIPSKRTTFLLGKLTALKPVQAFAEEVDSSAEGVTLSWSELLELAESIHQSVRVTVIGIRADGELPSPSALFLDKRRTIDRATAAFYDAVEVAFEAMDSAYWLVYVQDDAVRERIRAAFDEVEVIEVGW
jgi:hypothetical protein